jgi:hypothetical protein
LKAAGARCANCLVKNLRDLCGFLFAFPLFRPIDAAIRRQFIVR